MQRYKNTYFDSIVGVRDVHTGIQDIRFYQNKIGKHLTHNHSIKYNMFVNTL